MTSNHNKKWYLIESRLDSLCANTLINNKRMENYNFRPVDVDFDKAIAEDSLNLQDQAKRLIIWSPSNERHFADRKYYKENFWRSCE